MKICGIRTPEAARAAVRAGADALGFVFAESPRRVTLEEASLAASAAHDEAARDEAASAGRSIEAWGVVVNEPVDRLVEIAREVPLDVIQLHGDETMESARELASRLADGGGGGTRLVRAVRVRDAGVLHHNRSPASPAPSPPSAGLQGGIGGSERSRTVLQEIDRLWESGLFAAILLDAFTGAREGPRGGTGSIIDWDLARRAAERLPVVLAGGLTPDNVAEAVRRVRPRWVDASSGVESSRGVKDAALVERFVREARRP